jgi:hypothetical protein
MMFERVYLLAWLRAFFFTQLVEMPVYLLLLPVTRVRAFAASAVTHPFVWFVFPLLARCSVPYTTWSWLSELFAWLVEAAIMLKVARYPRALVVSFAANLASVVLGELCRHFFGYP